MLTPGANINVPGSLTVPRFIRLAIVGHTLEGNTSVKAMVNVLDWFIQTPLPGGDLTQFINSWQDACEAAYLDCLSSTYTLDKYVAKYLDNPLSIATEVAVGSPGTVATDRSASFNAGTIQKKTTVPSRNFRGAMHIGALPESFTTTDLLNATGQTAYNALVDAMDVLITTGMSDGAQVGFPIIISQTLSDLFASPAIFSYAAITDFDLNLTVGTMKRRKQKRLVA